MSYGVSILHPDTAESEALKMFDVECGEGRIRVQLGNPG